MTARRWLIRALLAAVVMTGGSFALNVGGYAAPYQYAVALAKAAPAIFARSKLKGMQR